MKLHILILRLTYAKIKYRCSKAWNAVFSRRQSSIYEKKVYSFSVLRTNLTQDKAILS